MAVRKEPGARLAWCVPLALLLLGVGDNPASTPTVVPAAPAAADDAVVRDRAEHLAALGVERWQRLGYRGQGCKIAVLDSGFRDYRDFLGKGLPPHVGVKSFRKDGNLEARDSQHGILCGEVLHALAPQAQLLFANWEPDNPNSFLEAVHWAKSEGARIVCCSLIMPNWSDGEGGGPVHAALAQGVGPGQGPRDLLFFACAGNTAQRHWAGSLRPNAQGFHEWAPGRIYNEIQPWGPERVAVELYGPIQAACELQVFDQTTGDLVGKASFQSDAPGGWGQAVVRFEPKPNRDYKVRLRCDGKSKGKFHLVTLGAGLEETTSEGSIPFPGDGACVQAVGAVDRTGKRLSYSSCGPNSRTPKPDFVGLVPFPSFCRQRPFAGTSAAAPQAAALAALCWSRYPHWTPQQVRGALQQAALDLHQPGHDWETGYGLIRLP